MIAENLAKIKNLIGETCQKIDTLPENITLLAVSKTVDVELIEQAITAGHTNFAENKVQELLIKKTYFKDRKIDNIKWHLIGHLQTNKVKAVVDNVDLFHCLDSIKLAEKINDYCQSQNKIFSVLIQINSSGESSKFGILPDEYPQFLKDLAKYKNLKILGIMSIGQFNDNPEQSRPEFKLMKQLFDYGKKNQTANSDFKYLSMGMSHDFSIAIEEGANIVRVGSAIFGRRNYIK